jgi:hypothetical protein
MVLYVEYEHASFDSLAMGIERPAATDLIL